MIICVGQFLEAIGEKPMDWDKVYAELEWAKKQLGELNEKFPPKNNREIGE